MLKTCKVASARMPGMASTFDRTIFALLLRDAVEDRPEQTEAACNPQRQQEAEPAQYTLAHLLEPAQYTLGLRLPWQTWARGLACGLSTREGRAKLFLKDKQTTKPGSEI